MLTQKQLWWLTVGVGFTVWEVSGAMRVTMVARPHLRPSSSTHFLELLPRSVVLGVAGG